MRAVKVHEPLPIQFVDWSVVKGIYSDAGLIGTNSKNDGGTWTVCYTDNEDYRLGSILYECAGVLLPENGDPQIENNQVETYALLRALRHVPIHWEGHVYCDNKNSVMRVFAGWAATNIPPEWFKYALYFARPEGWEQKDMSGWKYTLLGGHPSKSDIERGDYIRKATGKKSDLPWSPHNVHCDETCNRIRAIYESSTPEVFKKRFG